MASRSGVLYTGVTNNLERRVYEHKHGLLPGFSKKYQTYDLVYYDSTGNIESAITREKQVKGWLRTKKEQLIHTLNPDWQDLSEDFIDSSLRSE
jgi:putative endonuclease